MTRETKGAGRARFMVTDEDLVLLRVRVPVVGGGGTARVSTVSVDGVLWRHCEAVLGADRVLALAREVAWAEAERDGRDGEGGAPLARRWGLSRRVQRALLLRCSVNESSARPDGRPC